LGIVIHLEQSFFAHLGIDLRLCQSEYDLGRHFVGPQLNLTEVGFTAFGEAKGEQRPLLTAEENQRAIAAGLAAPAARDALLHQASAKIGIDQAAIGMFDYCHERSVADSFPARMFGKLTVLVDTYLRLIGHWQ
jgi:hypothetical protein